MRNILSSFKEDCRPSAKLNIFCPDYTSEELQYLVDFLYEGEFCCDNPEECEKIFGILNNFGFPKDLKFRCQKSSDVFPEVKISSPDKVPETSGISEHEGVTLEVTLYPNLFELKTKKLDDLKSQTLDDQNSTSSINEIISNLDKKYIFEDRNHAGKLFYCELLSED